MKRLFTLLTGICLVTILFAQPKTVLFLANPVPFDVGDGAYDQDMYDAIEGLGYVVTAEQISATSSVSGYDVVFASEAIPSADAGWPTYNTAPLPMVLGKVWAIKGPALGWVVGENDPVDYGNAADTVLVIAAGQEEHDLTCDLGDTIQIIAGGSAAAYVNFSVENPAGVTVVYKVRNEPDQHAIVTIDPGSTLNGKTLTSRVVIFGMHEYAYPYISDAGLTLLDNCLQYAISGMVDCTGPVEGINDINSFQAKVYPNPSSGLVNLKFNEFVSSATITIFAVDGRTIRTIPINNIEYTSLDLSDLSNGVYYINISGTNINSTQTISIQN